MVLKVDAFPKASEAVLQSALARFFDYTKTRCFPSVCMWTWEQDFVVITKAMKVWEVEIKISQVDWKADADKAKWETQSWSKVSRFYYLVPEDVLAQGVPKTVPHYAGILVAKPVKGQWHISMHKPAYDRSTFKLSEKWLHKLYLSTYYRFWRTRKYDPTSWVFTEAKEPIE